MTTLDDAIEAIRNIEDDDWNANTLYDTIKGERKLRSKRKTNSFREGDRVRYKKNGRWVEGEVYKTFRTNVGVDFDEPLRTGNPNTLFKIPGSELEKVEA